MCPVFVGNAAALSFLRFLQKTLKQYVGPTRFTDREHSHKWFEVTDPELDGAFSDDLDGEEKAVLIRCFMEAVSASPCLHLIHWLKQSSQAGFLIFTPRTS